MVRSAGPGGQAQARKDKEATVTINGMTSTAAMVPAATAAAGTPRQPAREGISVISCRIVIAATVLLTELRGHLRAWR
jgi:hypothetical protein